jgi:formylglycine-generating enzyme required for sulfatase activity
VKACCTPSRDTSDASAAPFAAPARVGGETDPAARFVRLAGGAFLMGAEDGAAHPLDFEGPVRRVRIAPFRLDAVAVCNRRFARFVAATGYRTVAESEGWSFVFAGFPGETHPPTGAVAAAPWWRRVDGACWRHPQGPGSTIDPCLDHPVTHVSHRDAQAYCEWSGARLPSEAEWEYAARGGAMHLPYVWGRELTPGGHWFANVWQGPIGGKEPPADGFEGRAPVGSFRTNDYGLADMAGNVWEWTADWYRPSYYTKKPRKDPPGPDDSLDPEEPTVPKRVARGGSYLSSETNGAGYRPSARRKVAPAFASSELGFRCVRSAK